tara:strand:+ start:1991 stop:2212 length:222 start_codon:yes stop_codon:yes gene_type:complete
MELLLILPILLILYVAYILLTKETFSSSLGGRKINEDILKYYSMDLGDALKWGEYDASERSFDKFQVGNSNNK